MAACCNPPRSTAPICLACDSGRRGCPTCPGRPDCAAGGSPEFGTSSRVSASSRSTCRHAWPAPAEVGLRRTRAAAAAGRERHPPQPGAHAQPGAATALTARAARLVRVRLRLRAHDLRRARLAVVQPQPGVRLGTQHADLPQPHRDHGLRRCGRPPRRDSCLVPVSSTSWQSTIPRARGAARRSMARTSTQPCRACTSRGRSG